MHDDDDQQRMARIANGDRAAFQGLIDRYESRVDRFLRRILSPSSVPAARNAVFFTIYSKAASFRGGSVAAWIYKIAWRAALNTRREEWGGSSLEIVDHDQFSDPTPGPREQAECAEASLQLQQALSKLSAMDRAIVWLCVVESMPLEQVARVLRRPASTLRYRFLRALEHVRAEMLRTPPVPAVVRVVKPAPDPPDMRNASVVL